ncbi:MAG: NAD-dependent epimerase/dehydratase family protein [Nitrososphaeraceae archaeon]|nr:NAD-dependent epimerase/dehydratase family protein [Nitrososphaeraceae archaeon]
MDHFANKGDDVTIIDNLSSNVLPENYFNSVADLFIGDIADISFLDAVFSREYDYIFHFAANASVSESVKKEDLNFKSNVIGTYNIIRKAAKLRPSIIFASTSAIYGEYNGKRVSEQDFARPVSPYGLSKLIDEDLCFHYGLMYWIKVVAFRLFNVYGPRQRRYVMPDLMEKISQASKKTPEKDIVMLGTGDEIRDLVNIKDVMRALMLPLKHDDMWGQAYNVGSGTYTKIKDVVYLVLNELNERYNITFSGKSWQGDISGLYADINKIRRVGFDPVIDLRTGIREFIEAESK